MTDAEYDAMIDEERLSTISRLEADLAAARAEAARLREPESDEAWMRRVYPQHAWSPDDGITYAQFCRLSRAKWEAEHASIVADLAAARAEAARLEGVVNVLAEELRRERTIASETETRLETQNARLRERNCRSCLHYVTDITLNGVRQPDACGHLSCIGSDFWVACDEVGWGCNAWAALDAEGREGA